MPDFWTTLKSNSSLASGDVWEHLQNQEGGDGGPVGVVLKNGLDLEVEVFQADVTINDDTFSVPLGSVVATFDIEVETVEADLFLEDEVLELTIDDDNAAVIMVSESEAYDLQVVYRQVYDIEVE